MFTEVKNGYKHQDAVPLKTVSTQEALAVACAAQRVNGGYIKDTRRFSEPENKTQFSNKEIVKLMQDAIKSEHNIVIWPDTIQGKDINEVIMSGISPDEIESIISSNTLKGLQAQVRFNMWKKI